MSCISLEPAVYGLAGTIIGGVIGYLTSSSNNKHALNLKKMELDYQSKMSEEKERRDVYGEFLGVCMFVEGCLDDIVTIIEKKEEGWVQKIENIFHGQDFSEAAQKLNMSAARVMLISEDERINEQIEKLDDCHEGLMTGIYDMKSIMSLKAVSHAQINNLKDTQKKLHDCIENLCKFLRRDLHASTR